MIDNDPEAVNVTGCDAAGFLQTATNYRPQSPSPASYGTSIFCKTDHEIGRLQRVLHNHPSGDPTPSQADIQMTRAIVDIATPLGIAVHDHIIVGRNGHAGLKALRLI
jgi:hypothetical protein